MYIIYIIYRLQIQLPEKMTIYCKEFNEIAKTFISFEIQDETNTILNFITNVQRSIFAVNSYI